MAYENLPEELKEYIDLEAGLARIMGNAKIYLKMLDIFVKNKEFENFRAVLETGDLEKASEVAHTIKGMTGNLSFTKLFEISSILNVDLKDGKRDDALIEQLFDAEKKTLEYIEVLKQEL